MGKHKNSQYGVILDAGSSGTRVYVYKWKNPNAPPKKGNIAAVDTHTLPKLKLEKSKKIHPGVSTFADDVSAVGRDHLQSLIDVAVKEVPTSKISETPVFLMATAGVRLLPPQKQQALLQSICTYFRGTTQFQLPDCDAHVQVISGQTEGLYGWIAANYLLGGFDEPDRHNHGKGHHTYGFLDMGGASAQIAFAPNATEADKHFDDLKLVRMRRSDGSAAEYKVFSSTWLGFGANRARERFVESLKDEYGESAKELPDPCLPKGLRTSLSGEPIESNTSKDQVLMGTGKVEECIRKAYPLLGKEKPCNDSPCLLNGQHAPAIDFDINHFVGVSEYWHTTHGVFGKEHNAYDLATYQQTVKDFCEREWSSIKSDIKPRKKTADEKLTDAQEACFKASWLINMLHDGIGIPRVGLEGLPSPGINTTHDALENAKGSGFRDPFLPVDKIDGVEVSWTLGKMILYAAGQIEPRDSDLPVGFGSNVKGISDDFEHAGSSPLSPGKYGDGDDDDDDFPHKKSASYTGLFLFALVIVAIAYWLRKPERRRHLFKLSPRRRRSGKGSLGLGFLNKFLGRNNATYERVLEEGEIPEFELGDVDSDDHSDSTEGSRAGRTSGLSTPKLNLDRPDDFRMSSVLDRSGHVIRTASREHLAPSLQMLNAGRRSRNVSPTRLKSGMAA